MYPLWGLLCSVFADSCFQVKVWGGFDWFDHKMTSFGKSESCGLCFHGYKNKQGFDMKVCELTFYAFLCVET